MFLRLSMLGLAIASVGLTGCAEIQELKINTRNRYLASEAWETLRETSECMNYESDFGRGFRAGYYDVANGGNGCPPPLPPERYWSVRYMSLVGRERTEAWFAGFRYGALVAQQDGIGVFLELPTSVPQESTRRTLPLPTPEQVENALPKISNSTDGSAPTTEPSTDDLTPVPSEPNPPGSTEQSGSPTPSTPSNNSLEGSTDQSLPPLDSPLLPDKTTIPGAKGETLPPGVPSKLNPINPSK
ncbi:hypothetical protein K2X85_09775 [bacterium]|jgi:hypothetical protein|nr:hypothetical protein [bacterium]